MIVAGLVLMSAPLAPFPLELHTAPLGQDHILVANVDLSPVAESHARRLFLKDRRPELYAAWLSRP